MQIHFHEAPPSPAPRTIARVVNQDALPGDLDEVVAEGAKASRFTGKAGQIFEAFVSSGGAIGRIVLAGLGDADASKRTDSIEKAGAALSAKYLTSGESSLLLDLTGAGLSADEVAGLLVGLRLRAWRHDAYRTKLTDEQKPSLVDVHVVGAVAGAQDVWEREAALAEGVEFARELVTEPGNVMYPESFVERCEKRMAGTGIELRVLDEAEMRALGMNALLGVSQGSVRPAQLLVMQWHGGEAGAKPFAFVGKGVTFDTGGISLKPPAGMEDMKWDMGGAAAVAGALLSLAGRKAKANVVGVCGLVENMPDGGAQRPGDVVTSMSGQTIEVINTDAEGRLVLCDALTWVQKEFAPTGVVDLATLTGAMVMTLGAEYAGVFANDDALADALVAAGKASGDKLWRFPLGAPYDKLIDSQIADMKNTGPRNGGSITAAQFLQRYIDKGRPWAHLDIAGVVWADKAGATWEKGATGYGVRLLDRYSRDKLEIIMRVDFYQLSRDTAESALPLIARAALKTGERLLVVSGDEAQLGRIGETLWALKESFLANGRAGGAHDARQPILLSDQPDPGNGARFLAIADGVWREGEAPFARTFFLFDHATLQPARDCWRMLGTRDGVERHFWKQEGGKWVEGP